MIVGGVQDLDIAPEAYEQEDYVMEVEDQASKEGDRRMQRRHRLRAAHEEDMNDTTIYENIQIIDTIKSEEDYEFITKGFKNHFVFYDMNDIDLRQLAQNVFYCESEEGNYVISQGQNASSFFLLKSGTIQIIIDDQVKCEMKPGDCFGELALLYNSERSASCKALTKCEIWGLNRPIFKKVVEQINKNNLYESLSFINKVKFFENFTAEQKHSIAEVLIQQKFQDGQAIVKQNDPASSFYIIKSGTVNCVKNGKKIGMMQPYDSFGESSLLEGDNKRALSIVAHDNVICYAIGRQVLSQILGEKVETAIFRNIALLTIKKLDGFSQLTKEQQENIVSLMRFQKTQDDQKVIELQGKQIKDQLVICIQGQIMIERSQNLLVGKYQGIGAQQIMQESNEVYPYNLVAGENSVYSILNIQNIQRVLNGQTLSEVLLKNKNQVAQSWMESIQRSQEVSQYKIEDFESLKFLGDGQFGQVYLVRNKQNQRYFCMKVLNKGRVVSMKVEKLAKQEKEVLTHINHDLVMKYYRSFQDEYNIYFLLEFVEGIELFEAIRLIGLLGTYDSQFYVGQIILQLEYLHSKDIVYRDLKPENMMVDLQGYLKMIDMGTSKVLAKDARTHSILGTPHYMAPEVLLGKGYDFRVDIWSLGIVFYEFMCGRVPFGEDKEDPIDIYREIFKSEVKFPEFLVDKMAMNLIRQFLNKIPILRLQGNNYNSVKQNPWFRHFDWKKLGQKQIKPNFTPKKTRINSPTFRDNIKGTPILDAVKEVAGSLQPPGKSSVFQWDCNF